MNQLPSQLADLEQLARRIRAEVVAMSHQARAAHLGSALSCVDILVAAYFVAMRCNPEMPEDPGRDRLILSKGHAISALYATLAERGYFSREMLATFNKHGGCLPEHPAPHCAPGVEWATGSLGHGLSVACGMALAQRIRGLGGRFFVVLSDGECEEGAVWEAAMFAPAQRLENVAVIIDYNQWQATGRPEEIMAIKPLADKWRAFGWNALELDGHRIDLLAEAMQQVHDGSGKPLAIIAHTVKGKGVSFMEDDNNWHYRIPNADEVQAARRELCIS